MTIPITSCFITGTDTGVGKTVVTAWLAEQALSAGMRVCVYKPVQTGCPDPSQPEDPLWVQARLARHPQAENLTVACSVCFGPPAAPYAADPAFPASSIDLAAIQADFERLRDSHDLILVEGAGGVRVPVTASADTTDLIRLTGLPALVVARPNLGTISHTLLTVEALLRRELPVLGVVVSGYPDAPGDDLAVARLFETWAPFLEVPLLGTLPRLALEVPFTPDVLAVGSVPFSQRAVQT